jgi:hypothetical protein
MKAATDRDTQPIDGHVPIIPDADYRETARPIGWRDGSPLWLAEPCGCHVIYWHMTLVRCSTHDGCRVLALENKLREGAAYRARQERTIAGLVTLLRSGGSVPGARLSPARLPASHWLKEGS